MGKRKRMDKERDRDGGECEKWGRKRERVKKKERDRKREIEREIKNVAGYKYFNIKKRRGYQNKQNKCPR
jgi:hypothetical protein